MKNKRSFLAAVVVFLALVCACLLPLRSTQSPAVTASAASGDVIRVSKYDVDMTVGTDRKVQVEEKITVTFLQSGLTMFYRSLPVETANYSDISASCEGNTAFSYYVDDNPDMSGFIDINCKGGVSRGATWTYALSYTMENGAGAGSKTDGMIVDLIGYGWSVPLENVTVDVHFPAALQESKVYVGGYGATGGAEKVTQTLSADKKTLTLTTPLLSVVYNDTYDEEMAEGITLDFTLEAGVLQSLTRARLFTEDMWKLVVGCLAAAGVAVVLLLTLRKKRELITVVNVKAPDDFDPLFMGKYIDGSVDNEDLTSMIYYFADKGYLHIDLSDEKDPAFTALVVDLPEDAPIYQKTLFDGLFASSRTVKVSQLSERYFQTTERAKKQLPDPPKMYEKRSIVGFVGGAVVGVLFAFIACFLMGKTLDKTYAYFAGVAFAIPVVAIAFLGYVRENYRYKWRRKGKIGSILAQLLIAAVFSVIFVCFFARHFMTGYEKIVVCVGAFAATFITQGALSRTQAYLDGLGEILGFKDFIVYTEEDKLKAMIEDDPQMYYRVLPYAQVLGVTDLWEKKFANILLPPPNWCSCGRMTVFDYLIINRCIRTAYVGAMMRAAQKQGGNFIGRSGGGGSFGGFGGGGFGGGGGGAR